MVNVTRRPEFSGQSQISESRPEKVLASLGTHNSPDFHQTSRFCPELGHFQFCNLLSYSLQLYCVTIVTECSLIAYLG